MKDYESLSRKHFDFQAKEYDQRNTYYYSGQGKISCKDLTDRLKDKDYEKLLDVGCGTGYLFELLTKQRNAKYIGVDLSEEMLKVARDKSLINCDFVQGSADKLPFEDNFFDIVTCSQSFHHYPYQKDAMKEVYRVLKSGGYYLISDTGIGGIGAWIDNNILFKLMNSGDCHTTNKKGIAKMMKEVGFAVVECKQVKGFIYTVIGKKQ